MRPENAMAVAHRERLWRLALALLPGLVLVLLRGVDSNWDLRNYHLYNPHAWLTGRLLTDIAPAQLQTWHNPLLDLPLYLLATSGLDMRWTSLWLTLPFAAAIYLLLKLQALLSPTPPSRGSQVVLALLALSGAATWSTIGNSMNDGFVAAALLAALWLVLKPDVSSARHWLLAGLVAGAMAGLKLTASAYCLALAITAIGADGAWRLRLRRLASLGLGGLLGFLASYGWWGWKMWGLFANPFFPYYNNVFRSPLLPPFTYADARFRGDGLLDSLLVPFKLLQRTNEHSELFLRDPRLLFGAVGTLLLFWLARRASTHASTTGRPRILMLFFWSSLVCWAVQYGIYRYAILLELIGVLALVLLLQRLRRGRFLALLLALVLVSVFTVRPNWGHTHITAPGFGIQAAPVPAGAMVVIARGEPLAYVALGLPDSVQVVGVRNNIQFPKECTGLQQQAQRAIAGHPGDLWLLSPSPASLKDDDALLQRYFGLRRSAHCWNYPSALGSPVLCPLDRFAPATVCKLAH